MASISQVKITELESSKRIDAEYYRPVHLQEELLLKNVTTKQMRKLGDFVTGPFGSEFKVENYVTDTQYRYIRGKDVKPFLVANDDNVYIPQNDYERLKKHKLEDSDILISVVGTLGNAAIITDINLPSIFSCKSTAFRSRSINPYYLITYLNCKYGHNILLRRTRGAVQTGLNIDDLRTLPIFEPTKDVIFVISETTKSALQLLTNSSSIYTQAEQLLLSQLGLQDWKPARALTFVRSYSQVANAGRMDAEYFHPK